ncbi:MAG: SEL1-like repeat protein [gamma proteobacterium symbiont of Lucinoma myriamae]|nr:SEL1-like repeat protein [gamma proteobacterium symbiont of Lucinoma myriamae]MCU7819793.1 SEL1-like repeat protein [gamma proteobacterium symbiont of Lucinoma myriamae]MCU7833120.1 SEL1-like repeat protein [gamma proteobacterium symbiont of Lucinoma myriamae]
MERPDLFLVILMSFFSAFSYATDANRIELQQAKTFILTSETDKALDIWKRLAEESDTEAQHQLGMYYLRLGKQSKDKSKAQTWLLKAAESGYIKSQYGLACLFESDSSELYDLDKARYWLEKAAQQGHRQSVKRLTYKNQLKMVYNHNPLKL